jgi:hypothetical protein
MLSIFSNLTFSLSDATGLLFEIVKAREVLFSVNSVESENGSYVPKICCSLKFLVRSSINELEISTIYIEKLPAKPTIAISSSNH